MTVHWVNEKGEAREFPKYVFVHRDAIYSID
jgi:hypothetical protein